MITATFTQSSYADAYGLWQWDYGQILRIQGLSLPTAVEIHFSLQPVGGESVTRIGITTGGVTDVLIPDTMLEAETSQNYDIYAFIYLTDEVSGETRHRIRMPVKARPKPSGRTLEEEVGKTTMAAIVEAVNTAIAGKADSMEISGHTLVLKSGETTIDEIDIPAVSEEAVQNAVNAYLQNNPMDEYVKFTDLASEEKAGVIILRNQGGLLCDKNGLLMVALAATYQMKDKSDSHSFVNPARFDYCSIQSTHQEMSETYDPSTALTPDGNVPYAYGGRQPVSYDAVKRYVDERQYDWLKEPVLEITLTEDTVSLYINEIDGQPFEFSEMACLFSLAGVTKPAEGRLTFAPKKIGASYFGIIVANANGAAGKIQKGYFKIKNRDPIGWHSLYSSNFVGDWLSGAQGVGRHIPIMNTEAYAGVFSNVTGGITEFTIMPYTDFLHAGSNFKIYGRPVKTEVMP